MSLLIEPSDCSTAHQRRRLLVFDGGNRVWPETYTNTQSANEFSGITPEIVVGGVVLPNTEPAAYHPRK